MLLVDSTFDKTQNWKTYKMKYMYIFIIVLLIQICIVFTQLCYISMQKEWHFNFKCEIFKHADLVWEWQKSCFQGLKISKFSRGGRPRNLPFIKNPLLKTWICPRNEFALAPSKTICKQIVEINNRKSAWIWNSPRILWVRYYLTPP